jgi:hypothetical protein
LKTIPASTASDTVSKRSSSSVGPSFWYFLTSSRATIVSPHQRVKRKISNKLAGSVYIVLGEVLGVYCDQVAILKNMKDDK